MEQQQQREAEDGPGVSQVLPMASEERPVCPFVRSHAVLKVTGGIRCNC